MHERVPRVREAGHGPGLVCLHANASSSSQWRALMDALADRHLVLAPDLYGAGQSPDWPSDRTISLSEEAAFLEPVFERAGPRFTLVGHSHGAAVALIAALRHPQRVRALVLYEPTLFSIVDAKAPPPNGADGIRAAVAASSQALDAGDRDGAAQHFIDFWMGAGSWAATPASRKPAITDAIVNVRRWAHALMTEPAPVQAFAALGMPILYMTGSLSPAPAHAVARELVPVLPHVQVKEFIGLGHMAPITHPEIVNAEIGRFLASL